MNAFMRMSTQGRITLLKKEKVKGILRKASKDPLFLADIREIEKDFSHSDFEKVEK
jgi:hypothetical protein